MESSALVGPNPHRLHSFGELRAINGRAWVVCRPCQRYAIVPAAALKDRDTRSTTFSCSVCGDRGQLVLEDPHKEDLQPDTRPSATHHPHAVARLRAFAKMAAANERQRYKPVREDLPQTSPRPKPEPAPRYVLRLFPCRTFGDLATWGLEAKVWCSRCTRQRSLAIGDNLAAMPLLDTPLRCTGTVGISAITPTGRTCGGRGRLSLMPVDQDSVPADPFVSVCCYAHNHTGIDAAYLVLNRPPWQSYLAKGDNFGCPGCRRRMRHTWHDAGSRTR